MIHALVRVGETRSRKVSNSTSSTSLHPGATVLFRKLVECLMWLANQAWPDIANAVKAVARYTNSSRKVHWKNAVLLFSLSSGFCDGTLDSGKW